MTEWEEKYLHERVERLENRINEQEDQIYRLQQELKGKQNEKRLITTENLVNCFAFTMIISCLCIVGSVTLNMILKVIKELMSG